jgi:nucleotidyltransferase substrate binding protein (TIGR01987 family)
MGIVGIVGSKGAVRQAFQNGLIVDGQIWIDMLNDRNLSAHSYDEATADGLALRIMDTYYGQFAAFARKMESMAFEDSAYGEF